MAIKALFLETKQTSNTYYKFKGRNESSSRIAERHNIFIFSFVIPEYSQYQIEDILKINLLKKGYYFVDLELCCHNHISVFAPEFFGCKSVSSHTVNTTNDLADNRLL